MVEAYALPALSQCGFHKRVTQVSSPQKKRAGHHHTCRPSKHFLRGSLVDDVQAHNGEEEDDLGLVDQAVLKNPRQLERVVNRVSLSWLSESLPPFHRN